jgi:enoyl-CoA hydratase
MTDTILREDRNNIVAITFNRPQKRNAITREMYGVLAQAVADLRDRDDLRVLLIRSAGPFFTAGADMNDVGMSGPDAAAAGQKPMTSVRRDYRLGFQSLHDEMEQIEKPIVVAIQGPCLGLGVELAGSADFRIAGESAMFALPEVNIGVIPGSGGTSRFTRLCGIGWSKWINMAGEQMSARTAQMAGFVQAVHPDDQLEAEVWAFCERLAERPQESMGVAKLAIELCHDLDREGARHVERIVNTPLMMRDNSDLIAAAMARNKRK